MIAPIDGVAVYLVKLAGDDVFVQPSLLHVALLAAAVYRAF